ncbi:hypothetical protein FNT36_20820 [Hymenobacter setariae]|uniref:Uncharacterized protein n=1 Tax=Hymenobacter setariae TaxID=2594794 RepID=A0A558BMA6_9BACT|nr:hypothetical protein [Hymenobacter setariae]TVT37623.1 hypothetical protein FNT36_20820 [Hymenobacter setariae]
MFKSLFFYGLFFLAALSGWAQTPNAPFIKISHLGTAGRPIPDLYLTTQEPALDAAQGLDGRYIFQNVCLLTATEFAPLLRYAESYATANKPTSKDTKFGTFAITLGASQPTPLVYTRSKAVVFLQGAAQVLQKQSPEAEKSEAVRRLEATARRLTTAAN